MFCRLFFILLFCLFSSIIVVFADAATLTSCSRASFIQNKGQWADSILFLSRLNNFNIYVTKQGVVFDCFKRINPALNKNLILQTHNFGESASRRVGHIIRLEPISGGINSAIPEDMTEERYNFFFGTTPSSWAVNVPSCKAVKIVEFCAGVDLSLQIENDAPRYDFIVHPNVDADLFAFHFAGASRADISADGATIRLRTSLGYLSTGGIIAFQSINGEQRRIPCKFKYANKGDSNSIGFDVGAYDSSLPLIIDPLVYSTYIGADGADEITGLSMDSKGKIIVAGFTESDKFPSTLGAYDVSYNGALDGFISKYDSTLGHLLFSSYYGGGADDRINAFTLDGNDDIYIVGETMSPSLPLVNNWKYAHGGRTDAFIAKMTNDGSKILYSTFFGGSEIDRALCVTADIYGNATVGGETNSKNYPAVIGGYQNVNQGGYDGFITSFTPAGSNVVFSAYIGGSGDDRIRAIKFNGNGGGIYFGGSCGGSLNKRVNDANLKLMPETVLTNKTTLINAFLAEWSIFNEDFSLKDPVMSSDQRTAFYGGCSAKGASWSVNYLLKDREITDIEFSSKNRMVCCGETTAANGKYDIFAFEQNPVTLPGKRRTFGGTGDDRPIAIKKDPRGNAYYIVGSTLSADFPNVYSKLTPQLQNTLSGKTDIFICSIDDNLDTLRSSTFIGGTEDDYACGFAVLNNGDFYIAGTTYSNNLQTFQESNKQKYNGAGDGCIFKAVIGSLTIYSPSAGRQYCPGGQIPISWTLEKSNAGGGISLYYSSDDGVSWNLIASDITNSTYLWITPANLSPGSQYKIKAINGSGLSNTTSNFSIGSLVEIVRQPKGDSVCPGHEFQFEFNCGGEKIAYQWYKGSQQITGANDSVLFFSSINPQDAGNYYAVASSACQTKTSETAALYVKQTTRVVEQPIGGAIQAGGTITFKVKAVGVNNKYQWFKDGYKLIGATDEIFTIQLANSGDIGNYSVIISGECGVDTSAIVRLNILSAEADEAEILQQLSLTVSNDAICIRFAACSNGDVSFAIADYTGRIISKITRNNTQRYIRQVVTFDADAMSRGIYWLIVSQNGGRVARSFVF